MIVDTHTHFYDPSRPQGVPWPGPDNELLYRTVLPEHYRAVAEPEGVTGTVVVEASAWLEDNQWILDLAAEETFLLGLVGHIDPNREEFVDELERFAQHPRFCGIRCGAGYFQDVGSGRFLRDLEQLAKRDLQLDVLVRSEHFMALDQVAEAIPSLRIVINHIGHVPIDGTAPDPSWVDHINRVAARDQVYMKVSALMEQSTTYPASEELGFYAPTLEAMWQAFGEDRLIYGSNWPVCERAGSFKAAQGIVKNYFEAKGQEAAEKYFWKNAQAVYKWGGKTNR
jgi:L-fuconolactonase